MHNAMSNTSIKIRFVEKVVRESDGQGLSVISKTNAQTVYVWITGKAKPHCMIGRARLLRLAGIEEEKNLIYI